MKKIKTAVATISICILLGAWNQPDCRNLNVAYAVDLSPNLSRLDKSRDSILVEKNEIELHFREDINGNYKILINDSLFFEGKLKGDPRIGYEPRVFNIPVRPGNNVLTLGDLEREQQSVTIKLNTTYKYLILQKQHHCTILAKSANKRPFRG